MFSFYDNPNSPWYIPYSSKPICLDKASSALDKRANTIEQEILNSILKANDLTAFPSPPQYPDPELPYETYAEYRRRKNIWDQRKYAFDRLIEKTELEYIFDPKANRQYVVWQEPFYKNINVIDYITIRKIFYHEINPKFNNPQFTYSTTEFNSDTNQYEDLTISVPDLIKILNQPENRLEDNSDPRWNTRNLIKHSKVPCYESITGPTGSVCFQASFQLPYYNIISGNYYYLYEFDLNTNKFKSANFLPSTYNLPSAIDYDGIFTKTMDLQKNTILNSANRNILNSYKDYKIPSYHINKNLQQPIIASSEPLIVSDLFKNKLTFRKRIKTNAIVTRKCGTENREQHVANLVCVSTLSHYRDIVNATIGINNSNPSAVIKCKESKLLWISNKKVNSLTEDDVRGDPQIGSDFNF